ncbi:MAG: hypothetical protein KDJ47_06495 [Hyphomicrobiaceae bacterium]|nr:hypothetical protein [Hyphomicrobiaceae bacterium]
MSPASSILILCRTNSVTSTMIEALLNANEHAGWRAFSAGPEPALTVNTHTMSALKNSGISARFVTSPKCWHLFEGPDAPRFDVVLTVSEDVSWDGMPKWNGVPRLLHWPLPDPLALSCTPAERAGLFAALLDLAATRVEAFLEEEREAVRVGSIANDNSWLPSGRVGT